MGKFSRDKGKRGEYMLRDFLIARGYHAVRVPLSGASQGYKGDVVASKNGVQHTLELKCRKNTFNATYQAFERARNGEVLRFYDLATNTLVAMSYDFDLINEASIQPFQDVCGLANESTVPLKEFKKIVGYKKFIADHPDQYLVIKGDRQPLLFIRYK